MTLFEQTLIFYKLATEEAGEATYKEWVQNHIVAPISGSIDLNEVLTFIHQNYKEPYFKVDDFLSPIYTALVAMPHFTWRDIELLPDPIAKEFKERLLAEWVNDPEDEMDTLKFINYFDKEGTQKTRRAAQAKVLKHIQQLTQDEKIYEVIRDLGLLSNNSTSFTSNFLDNFAKHLGIEVYSEFQKWKWEDLNRIKSPEQELMEKDKLSVFDIASYFNYRMLTFNYKQFEPFLTKADDRAREYMRRFVYCAAGQPLFIFDENMQPIGLDYQNVPWPKVFGPLSINRLSKEHQEWLKLMHDFNIVPA